MIMCMPKPKSVSSIVVCIVLVDRLEMQWWRNQRRGVFYYYFSFAHLVFIYLGCGGFWGGLQL